MPEINVTIPHNLTADEARERIKNLLKDIKSSYSDKISGLQESWSGNTGTFSFKAMGFNVNGKAVATDSEVIISGDLPFSAIFFKGKIENTIKEKGQELLR